MESNGITITKMNAILSLVIAITVFISSVYGAYQWMLSVGDSRWASVSVVQTVYANSTKITLQQLYRQRTDVRDRILDLREQLMLDPDNLKIEQYLEEAKKELDGISEDIRRIQLEGK